MNLRYVSQTQNPGASGTQDKVQVDPVERERAPAARFSWATFAGICLVSALLCSDLFLRASVKCFWADELVTIYLCRLPGMHSIWNAVQHGVDANPPLFYALTWGSEHLFGEGPIASRLPEILGFYLFCLCLYLFVSRTMGRLAGFVSGVFPLFTLAQYYAFEARPHALTLGFCGLALVCWQRSKAGPRRRLFLLGFFLSLVGALMVHVYATFIFIPFFFAELYEAIRTKRIDWAPTTAMALAVATATPVYITLLTAYAHAGGSGTLPVHSLGILEPFLLSLFGRSILILLTASVITGIAATRMDQLALIKSPVPSRDLVLALGFASMPILAILSLRLTHGPFFFRYFLSSIAGYAIFFGASYSAITGRRMKMSWWLPGFMLIFMFYDLKTAIQMQSHHDGMIEPTSGFVIGSPSAPMAGYQTLMSLHGNEDILVLQQLDADYFMNYAPEPLRSHLFIGGITEDDPAIATGHLLVTWTPAKIRSSTFAKFFATRDHFFVYGSANGAFCPVCGNCELEFLNVGFTLTSVRRDADRILYEYKK